MKNTTMGEPRTCQVSLNRDTHRMRVSLDMDLREFREFLDDAHAALQAQAGGHRSLEKATEARCLSELLRYALCSKPGESVTWNNGMPLFTTREL